jgi:hypothetical protein
MDHNLQTDKNELREWMSLTNEMKMGKIRDVDNRYSR